VGRLPDSKLPISSQLEQAISTIKANVRIILDTQAESKALKQVGLYNAVEIQNNIMHLLCVTCVYLIFYAQHCVKMS